MITVRNGKPQDVFKLSQLWLNMLDELSSDLSPNPEWWRLHVKRFLHSGDYFIFVAEKEYELVGFIDYFLFSEPATGKIHCIGQHFYVSSKYRKTSIPGRLYKKVIVNAKKQGAKIFELFCFAQEKPFWEKHGYKQKRILMSKK